MYINEQIQESDVFKKFHIDSHFTLAYFWVLFQC
jgi:hypothetical protein